MPSLVKSNSALASGGIALLEQNVSTRSSTELVVTAKFVALKAHMDKWAARLQPGSVSPVALNYSGNALAVASEPVINTVSITVSSGLVFFDCQFAASRLITDDGTNLESSLITSSSTISLQSFSGSKEFQLATSASNFELITFTPNVSFDYYAESKTLSSSSRKVFEIAQASLTTNSLYVGKAFNINTSSLGAFGEGLLGGPLSYSASFGFSFYIFIDAQVVLSTSIQKNESGGYSYQATGTVRMLQQPDAAFAYENPLTRL
jgi:hypothetical protein